MPGNYELLSTSRIARIIEPLADRRQNPIPDNLRMLNRTPDVNKTDGEIQVSHAAIVFAADVIADDQQAVVRTSDTFELQPSKIPNLKHGNLISQDMLNLLQRINAGFSAPGENDIFTNYTVRKLNDLIAGIRTRKEALLWQMALDNGVYDRLGIKFNGVSWGMPADLKVTPGILWTNTTAKPITDILALVRVAGEKYGKVYNRIELSSTDFDNAVKTDEFKAQAQLFSGINFPAGSVPFANIETARTIFGRLLNLTVEINDFQYATQGSDGSITQSRFLPLGKVRLSNTADDNNAAARDFAGAIVTESIIGSLPGVSVLGGAGLGGPRRGPLGYATPRSDLNPPNVVLWAVERGFPEKLDKTESAVLTVQ